MELDEDEPAEVGAISRGHGVVKAPQGHGVGPVLGVHVHDEGLLRLVRHAGQGRPVPAHQRKRALELQEGVGCRECERGPTG